MIKWQKDGRAQNAQTVPFVFGGDDKPPLNSTQGAYGQPSLATQREAYEDV